MEVRTKEQIGGAEGAALASGGRGVVLGARDMRALVWVAEQGGVTVEDLAQLLGREKGRGPRGVGNPETSLAVGAVYDVVRRWRRAGVARSRKILVDDPTWVWLTRAGLRLVEPALRIWLPADLQHQRLMNAVRLQIEAANPDVLWRSERVLRSEGYPVLHLPDAVVTTGDVDHAIEVERTQKSARRYDAILAAHLAQHERVVYYVAAGTRSGVDRAVARLPRQEAERVVIRPLPVL
jgi:hypothetical protein